MLEQLEFMVITCGQQQTWLSCVHASAVFVRRCFALWALNNVTKTGNKCLWQESVGGSAGVCTVVQHIVHGSSHQRPAGSYPGEHLVCLAMTYRCIRLWMLKCCVT